MKLLQSYLQLNLAKDFKKGWCYSFIWWLRCWKNQKFVEGILNHYDLQNEISSPTFTIVNEYHNRDVDIFHFDLYRLGDIYEFENIGGEEYFNKGICIFEWGELIEDILPENYIKISFEKDSTDPDLRTLKVETFGQRFENINFKEFEM